MEGKVGGHGRVAVIECRQMKSAQRDLNRQKVHESVHASGRDDVVNYFQEWFLARSRHALSTTISKFHLWLPYHADGRFADRQSLPDYYACPSAMITANTPVCRPHQLLRVRLKPMNNGPRHSAAVMLAHIFLQGFIVFLYWPFAKHAIQSALSAAQFLPGCRFRFPNPTIPLARVFLFSSNTPSGKLSSKLQVEINRTSYLKIASVYFYFRLFSFPVFLEHTRVFLDF